MKFVSFVLEHLKRNWIRSASTAIAIALCIFLFCTLQTFVASLKGFRAQGKTRLITHNGVSRIGRLPPADQPRIASVPGVKRVAVASYFGGVLDLRVRGQEFPTLAIDADDFLAMYPEFELTNAERSAFLSDVRGCVIGRALAEEHHWKPGDVIQLQSNIPAYRTPRPFEFIVRAIYHTNQDRNPGTTETLLFFHRKYLDEMLGGSALVGTYRVEIADARQAGVISHAIDAQFENSDAQTQTETEAQYRAGVDILGGNLAVLLNGIGLSVMFTILLVTANTMSMAVRERRTEVGVLKTIGFSSRLVLLLILAESVLLGASGAVAGLLMGRFLVDLLPKIPVIADAVRGFPRMSVPPAIGAIGIAAGVLLGVVAGLLPSIAAYRARVTDLLRQA